MAWTSSTVSSSAVERRAAASATATSTSCALGSRPQEQLGEHRRLAHAAVTAQQTGLLVYAGADPPQRGLDVGELRLAARERAGGMTPKPGT